MIFWLLIAAVVGCTIWIIISEIGDGERPTAIVSSAFAMFGCCTVVAFFFYIVPFLIVDSINRTYVGYYEERVKIYSVANKDRLEGTFYISMFIGSGSGKGELATVEHYHFFKDWRGGIIRDSVPAPTTTIYEHTSVEPHVKKFTAKMERKFPWWLGPRSSVSYEANERDRYFELHVPKGTVINIGKFKIE